MIIEFFKNNYTWLLSGIVPTMAAIILSIIQNNKGKSFFGIEKKRIKGIKDNTLGGIEKTESLNVIILIGGLYVYPENIGPFLKVPKSTIEGVNTQKDYGYSNWRLPTTDEVDILASKLYDFPIEKCYLVKDDDRYFIYDLLVEKRTVHYDWEYRQFEQEAYVRLVRREEQSKTKKKPSSL